jgi:MFS family permease
MAMSVFVVANDLTALSVALPQIEQDLDSDVSTIQWVVSAYALVFGVLIVTGGRLADMLGRRRIFFIGAAIFAGFSVLGGFAQSDLWLIGCRALMGVGGAMMWPAVLGMTYDILPADRAALAGGLIRQRGRPAARRRAHRRPQLALDPVRQPADCRIRLLRHLAERAREHRRGS